MRNFLGPRVRNRGQICSSGILGFIWHILVFSPVSATLSRLAVNSGGIRLESGIAGDIARPTGVVRKPLAPEGCERHVIPMQNSCYSGLGILDPLELYCARWLQQVRCKFRYSHAAQHDIHGACFFVWVWGQPHCLARDMRSLFRMHGNDALCSAVISNAKDFDIERRH